MKVGLVGCGFVGTALLKSFKKRDVEVVAYDKFKEEITLDVSDDTIEILKLNSFYDLFDTSMIFLCLPTPFIDGHGYDLLPIIETFEKLKYYTGLIVIKSTVEPGITQMLADKYNLQIMHNPEFLTERTAFEDFDNQKHIVLGYSNKVSTPYKEIIKNMYSNLWPDAKISECTSEESESMKLFCNNFYAMKVGIMNEFNLLCQKMLVDYNNVIKLMIENGWINKMHTSVPGPDGRRGWGGNCFIKDTNALSTFMKSKNSPSEILDAAIRENKKIRGSKK